MQGIVVLIYTLKATYRRTQYRYLGHGARAGSLLCGEGTNYTVSREVVCGTCSHKSALENQTKKECNMSAASIDETSLVEDVF